MADNKNKTTYAFEISSKQLDELEKAATNLGFSNSGQMLQEFIKTTLKGYRDEVLKRDADLENIKL